MAQVDKYKKVSLNGGTIFGLLIFFIIVGGLIYLMIPTPKERIYNAYSKQEGNTLTVNHNLVEVSFKSLQKKVDKMKEDEYIIVYYGDTSCSSCVSNIGSIVTYTRDKLEIDEVLYLKSGNEDLDEKDIQVAFENEKMGTITPEIWLFKNGKFVLGSFETRFMTSDKTSVKWDTFWNNIANEMGKTI